MVVSIAFYLVFLVLWNGLANAVTRGVAKYVGLGYPGKVQTILFIRLLNPMTAYKTLVNGLILSSQFNARVIMFGILSRQGVAHVLGKPLPFYLSDAAVMIYLLFWLLVPVAIGYSVFSRADL
jgi:ABC-2 type transport system permease protein